MAKIDFKVDGFDELAKDIEKITSMENEMKKRVLVAGSEEIVDAWKKVVAVNIQPNNTKRLTARIRKTKIYEYYYNSKSTGTLQQSIDYNVNQKVTSSSIYPKGTVKPFNKKIRNATKAFILNYGVVGKQMPTDYISDVMDIAETTAVEAMEEELKDCFKERGL